LLSVCIIAFFTGCGTTATLPTTPPAKPTSVLFVSPPPALLAVKASASLFASAIYPNATSTNTTAVTYAVTCGSAGACGTLTPNDEAGAITYTAPANIPSGGKVTITATSVADTTKSASATITIVPPIPIAISFFAPPPASLQINSMFALSAGIVNDVSANPQVRWTVACSASSCGSFSPSTTTDEAQTTYTAPSAIPPDKTVTVTVTSLTDSTKSASTSIVITPAAPTLADGTYVFQVPGQAGSAANFLTGVFTAKGGAIMGGEQDSIYYLSDSNNNSYGYSSSQQITGGSYSTTADGNMQISLQAGQGALEVLSGTLASSAKGFVANLNGLPASGSVDLQTSTAAPSGGYALTLSGGDQYQEAAWIGGIVNIDGSGTISGSGSILDVIDGQIGATGAQSVGASTVSAPDAYGRFTFQLANGNGSILPTIDLVGYVIDSTHLRLIETGDQTDNTNFQGVLGGSALCQGSSAGHFTTGSLTNASYVFGAQGSDTNGTLQLAGVLTPKSDGSLAGTLNWNDLTASTAQKPVVVTGTYTIDPTGRVTFSNISDGSTLNYAFHLYLTGDGNALLLSNQNDSIFVGQAFQQQTASFTASSFSGNYGLNASTYATGSTNPSAELLYVNGSLTATPGRVSTALSGFADYGNNAADFAIGGTLTPATDGILEGTLTGFNPDARNTPASFTLYLVDGSRGILIETDNAALTLGQLQNVP
jgi:hypothetical protein